MIIDGTDLAEYLRNTQDADVEALDVAAAAASNAVVEYCGRTFDLAGEDPTQRLFKSDDSLVLQIDDNVEVVVVEVDVLGTGDFVQFDGTWRAEPLNGLRYGRPWPYEELVALTGRWPLKPAALISVEARWGWPALPDDVRLAALIKGARLFKRKDSPEGVLGGFVDFGPVRISRDDPDIVSLLDPYRPLTVFA